MKFAWKLAAAFLAAAISSSAQGPSAARVDTISAAHSAGNIKLDGHLDEPAWQAATQVKLVQQSPSPGRATPFETTVRILITDDFLYFGFDCVDPEPQKIAVHTLRRDGETEGDDTVTIVLDTYGDRRTGYFFQVNAAGARIDGLISGPDSSSRDWDGIWNARTARDAHGWSAEIVVPARTLNFTRGLRTWGLNLERHIARARMNLRWTSSTLDSFLYDLSRAGDLSGVEGMKQGHGLEFSPFFVGRTRRFFQAGDRSWQGQPGMDVTWHVTPQLAAVLTANTDFAETEVDARRLNITRFPLFFPERRAFFLEGANQYNFGLGLRESFIPFFSRHVGLFNGQQVPINFGVKLNGRQGRWNIGVLDVQTRDTPVAPGTNLFAGRFSYDVTQKWRVGTLVTHGNPSGLQSNTLVGFDTVWRTSKFHGDKNFLVGAWTAFSAGDLPAGNRTGWGFAADYPNDLWDCNFSTNHFGDALDPALGFLPRPGSRQYNAGCAFQPRPSREGRWKFIRQHFFELYLTRVDNLAGENESWRVFWAPINIRFNSGDRFEFNWAPQHEFLPVPFEIAPGVVLPVGSYQFNRFRLEAQSSEHRSWRVGTTNWFGQFYNGTLYQSENYVNWTSPEGRFQAGLTADQNFGRLQQGHFVQRLWQLQFTYAFNPDLVLTSFLQYDNESQNFGHNTRLRWTIKPGNDLFIVWNRGWTRLITSARDLNLVPESELVAVKLRLTFRK